MDGSDGAQAALRWVVNLAESAGASVHAVHVLTFSKEFMRDISFETMTNWRRDLELQLKKTWTTALTESAVAHRCTLVEDESPALGLIHVAERDAADLIVVGATGRTKLGGKVLGSTSYTLTHNAPCAVAVVPPAHAH